MTLLIVYLILTLGISFYCSILESVLYSTPISFITSKIEEGYKPAVRFKQYKQESSRPIAAILSLNTISNTAGATLIGRQATIVLGDAWFGLVSVLVTIMILLFAEILPKNIGTTRWRHLMGFTATNLRVLIVVLYPIVILIELINKWITPKHDETMMSREEVSAMANVAEEEEVIDEDENEMIQNIMKMDNIAVSEAMTPRVVCNIAAEDMTVRSFYQDKKYKTHSRIPVYKDDDDYITGYVLRTDVLQLIADDKFDCTLGSIRRHITLIREDEPLGHVWDAMLDKKEQICCVIDEYGSFQGILSMEDIIETLIGSEIVDENDETADMQAFAKQQWATKQKNLSKEGASSLLPQAQPKNDTDTAQDNDKKD